MAEIPRIVEQQVGQALNNMMPSMFEYMRDWLASGQQGLPPIPSFTSSNSHNALVSPAAAAASPAAAAAVSPAADALVSPAADALVSLAAAPAAAALVTSGAATTVVSPGATALVTPAAEAFVPPTAARVLERRTPDPSGASAPSGTCMPAVGGPSTL